jgi:hypothetical protein
MSLEDLPASMQDEREHSPAIEGHHAEDPAAQRLHDRHPFGGALHLCWEEAKGVKRRIRAHGIDRSKFGILVEAERPIATGTIIAVEGANFVMLGRAAVRHCTPKGMNYRIGLYMPDLLARDL